MNTNNTMVDHTIDLNEFSAHFLEILEHLTTIWLTPTEVTSPLCPVITRNNFSSVMLHTRIVLSLLPETMRFPSGCQATDRTSPV